MFRTTKCLLVGCVAASVLSLAQAAQAQNASLSTNFYNPSQVFTPFTTEIYPVFLWNYGSWRSYERWEKKAILSRWKRETAENNVGTLQAKYALKDMHRERQARYAHPRVKVVNLGVPRQTSAAVDANILSKTDGRPAWPAVLLYRGFAMERQHLDTLLSLPSMDIESRTIVTELLQKMQAKLAHYHNESNIVISRRDYFQGKSFLKALLQEVGTPAAPSPISLAAR